MIYDKLNSLRLKVNNYQHILLHLSDSDLREELKRQICNLLTKQCELQKFYNEKY